MAIERFVETPPPWTEPSWPDRLPEVRTLHLIYGDFADELLVDLDSGSVFGVHIYPLAANAVKRHPSWRAAVEPNPDPSVAARIVSDIKDLFDRYGIETGS